MVITPYLSKLSLTLKLKYHKGEIWSYIFGICSFWYLFILAEPGAGNDEIWKIKRDIWTVSNVWKVDFNLAFSQLFKESFVSFRAIHWCLLCILGNNICFKGTLFCLCIQYSSHNNRICLKSRWRKQSWFW